MEYMPMITKGSSSPFFGDNQYSNFSVIIKKIYEKYWYKQHSITLWKQGFFLKKRGGGNKSSKMVPNRLALS